MPVFVLETDWRKHNKHGSPCFLSTIELEENTGKYNSKECSSILANNALAVSGFMDYLIDSMFESVVYCY